MPVSQHHGGAEPNVTPSMREPSEASITAPLFSSSTLIPASENVTVDLRPDEGENRDAFVQALDACPRAGPTIKIEENAVKALSTSCFVSVYLA